MVEVDYCSEKSFNCWYGCDVLYVFWVWLLEDMSFAGVRYRGRQSHPSSRTRGKSNRDIAMNCDWLE